MDDCRLIESLRMIVEDMTCIGMDGEESFNEAILEDREGEISEVCATLGISPMQAVLLSAILEESSDRVITRARLAAVMGMPYVRMLTLSSDIDMLSRKGLVHVDSAKNLRVPARTVDALVSGCAPEPADYSHLDPEGMMSMMEELFEMRSSDDISERELLHEIDALFAQNPKTALVRESRKLGVNGTSGRVNSYERLVYYYMLHEYVNHEIEYVFFGEMGRIFEDESMPRILARSYRRGSLVLQTSHMIEPANKDGLTDCDMIRLTDEVRSKVTSEFAMRSLDLPRRYRTIHHEEIMPRELFFNEHETVQLARLQRLLEEDNYTATCRRLREKGLRPGFTCLFYGVPGTGKTEMAHQLARVSGRDIIPVDFSGLKSPWVGESEHRVREVFDVYSMAAKVADRAPILLFNEADAIFGIRQEGAQRAVDKMENTLQNIILQAMEDFDGILVATTNLTGNLDKAFDRRFLYKIRFNKPEPAQKAKIWKYLIPSLTDVQADRLASAYDFSGGQIENVVRKREIHYIIDGAEPTYEEVMSYCGEELIDGRTNKKIGYGR